MSKNVLSHPGQREENVMSCLNLTEDLIKEVTENNNEGLG